MVTTNPSVLRLLRVVRALGPLAEGVVFIGGAVAPLLHTDPVMTLARQTKDVDGVVASLGYAGFEALSAQLRARSFRHVATPGAHAYRWVSPDSDLFDLIPSGPHLGGTDSAIDAIAIETAVPVEVDGVRFRHVAPATFMVMKFLAFSDRGAEDWFGSHDIEDVIALLASRPAVSAEVGAAPERVRDRLIAFARAVLANETIDDVLAAHLNNAIDPAAAERLARARLTEIAALG